MQSLMGKPEGIYVVGRRCYRVARLFDECGPRREDVSRKAAALYRGVYAGNCTIIYSIDVEICLAVLKKQIF